MKKEELSLNNKIDKSFRPFDIRGIYKEELTDEIAYRTGKAFVVNFKLKGKEIFVGRDMRLSSPKISRAFMKGACDQGASIIDLGLIDSPGVYFASGKYKKAGAMITASHNPAKYNGIKLVISGARPVGWDSGLNDLKILVKKNKFKKINGKVKIKKKNIYNEYKNFLHSHVKINLPKGKKLKIVVDAGNGMAGRMVPLIFKGLPIQYKKLFFKLNGNFPNHVPNPVERKNVQDCINAVKRWKADLGIIFDGDMDRVAFVDNTGKYDDISSIGSLLAKHFLRKRKGPIVFSSVNSRIGSDTIKKYGGKPVKEKVGHVNIKATMRKLRADFGWEASAHFFYKKMFYTDSGLFTALLIIDILSDDIKDGRSFVDSMSEFRRYYKIEELVFRPKKNMGKIIKKIEVFYKKKARKIDYFDGLGVDLGDVWFSVRKSGTEYALKLNLEGISEKIAKKEAKRITMLIKKFS